MAIQDNNPVMKGASGLIGNVVFRQVRGKTIVAARPKRGGPRSPKQLKQQKKIVSANKYAKIQMQNAAIEQEYRSGISDKLVDSFRVAVADYMNAPVVHEIRTDDYTGAAGSAIKIKATDDFKVLRVLVEIVDGNGTAIEKGEAVCYFNRPNFWKYQTTTSNKHVPGTLIRVTAFDRPENKGFMEVML